MNLKDDEHLKFIIECAPIGIAILAATSLKVELLNDKFLEIAGKPKDAIIGKWYWEPFAEAQVYYEDALNSVVRTGKAYYADEVELMLIRHGREENIYVTFVYAPVSNEAGEVSKVAVWVLENTRQVKERRAITASEERFRALVTATSDVVYSLSADWEVMRPLDGRGFLQDTQEPITGWRNQNVHPDDMEIVNAAIAEAIRDKKIFQLEHRVLRADGSPGWTFSRAVPILGIRGEIVEWFGMASDITKKKNDEQQLQLLINMLPASVVVIRGQDLLVEMINQANLDYWKKTAAEVVGKPFLSILPDLADQPFAGQLRQVMATGEVIDVKESRVLFENPDGTTRETFVDYTYQPLTNSAGKRDGVLVMSFEITDRVIARRQVEQSEENLKAMIAQAPVAMCILTGPGHVITVANQLMVELWGKPQAEVMNKPVFDALPDARGQGLEQVMDKVYETGETFYASELPVSLLRHGQQEIVYQDFVYQAYRDAHGSIVGIIAITVDVTEQVDARQELQQINEEMAAANEELATTNEELTEVQQRYEEIHRELETSSSRLRMAIESTSLGTWEYNPQSGDLYWSKECRVIYGIPDGEEPTFAKFSDHIHPDDRRWVEAAIQDAIDPAGEGRYDISYRIIRFGNGETRWIKAQGSVYFEENHPVRFIGTVVDIHELKEAEEKSAKLAAIIETSHDAIISKTLDGIITSWNESAQRVFGFTAEEMIGESIYKLIPLERHAEEPRILATIARGERINHFETQRLTRDGRLIDVSVTVSPVKDKTGNIIGVSKIARDITEKKLDETRKNDFIGMVSHELKTPLTSLSAIIQVANSKLRNSEDAFLTGAMQKANVQVKRMSTMINGFLNVSRLESAMIHIDKQDFPVDELISEVIEETRLTNSNHRISFDHCPPINVLADHDKISSVISNLLGNAIKYSPTGTEITIRCKVEKDNVTVSVRDEGMGIAPEDAGKIFDRYYRVQSGKGNHISGFGIGLYVSAEIIRRHDGRIWVESEPGKGSTFYFSLPLNKPAAGD
jgi:PAS domain S-box-containing protein